MKNATILITRPLRSNDPTQYTYQWASRAVQIAKNLGYDVIDIEKEDTTYDKVSETIKKYRPRLYTHFGHGCPASLQGNKECIVTKKYTVDQLISMAENPDEREDLLKLLNPLGYTSCPGICKLDNDPCSPLCLHDTNVNLLKNSIVYAVACHSAQQLGKYAVMYGADVYIGYQDLFMFPVDSKNTQDMFGEVQLTMFKELLMGKTVQEALQETEKLEDKYIRKYKKIKYVSLPLLWNKLKRKVLGNTGAMIYGQII